MLQEAVVVVSQHSVSLGEFMMSVRLSNQNFCQRGPGSSGVSPRLWEPVKHASEHQVNELEA